MTDSMAFQNIDISFWDTLYIAVKQTDKRGEGKITFDENSSS